MKRTFIFLILATLIFGKVSAQSDVSFFCQDGLKFWVIINGIKQNDSPQTNVKVSGLTATNYLTKVIFEDNTIPAIEKRVYTKDADGRFISAAYNIRKDKNGQYVMRLNSYDEAGFPTTGQYTTQLWVEERPVNNVPVQTTTTQQTTTISSSANSNVNGGGVSINAIDPVTGESINMNVSVNAGNGMINGGGVTTTTTTTTTTSSSSSNFDQHVDHHNGNPNDHYIMQGYNGKIGCPWPMSQADFQAAKNTIQSKSFDDSKLTIAKQVISSNCLFCSQVREIMLLFSFEDTRLQFAKFAFPYVYDQGNYFKLNDAFTFESSVDELNQYINGR